MANGDPGVLATGSEVELCVQGVLNVPQEGVSQKATDLSLAAKAEGGSVQNWSHLVEELDSRGLMVVVVLRLPVVARLVVRDRLMVGLRLVVWFWFVVRLRFVVVLRFVVRFGFVVGIMVRFFLRGW